MRSLAIRAALIGCLAVAASAQRSPFFGRTPPVSQTGGFRPRTRTRSGAWPVPPGVQYPVPVQRRAGTGLPLPLPLPLPGAVPAVPAQPSAPASPPKHEPLVGDGWVSLSEYSEVLSRAGFSACDRDCDDRLSILEVAPALDGIRDARDHAAFRRLDQNADGYVEWPEFDQRFRDLIGRGRPFVIRPVHPFPPKERHEPVRKKRPKPASGPLDQVLALLDADGDGSLGVEEGKRALAGLGLPPTFVKQFEKLDSDGSGDLSEEELAPLATFLPGIAAPPAAADPSAGSLQPGYVEFDEDENGVLDGTEIRAWLDSLDPALVRWSQKITQDADKTGNGTLGPLELQQAAEHDR